MNIPTFEELQNMTDEEINDLNRKLALRVVGRFAAFMIIKRALIFSVTRGVKKLVEHNTNVDGE